MIFPFPGNMARSTFLLAVISCVSASVLQADLLHADFKSQHAVPISRADRTLANISKRQGVVTPDGTCGGANGYTCTGSQGGVQPCCSASGFCGAGPSYCDAGCQSSFGTCGTPPSAAGSSHQTVLVGANGLSFTPDTIYASPGSRISFQFSPGHHSVAQSSFSDPCHPLSSSSIYSGFVDDTSMIWTIPVIDTNPIYLYCSAPVHCQIGMVMVINPPSNGGTLDGYRTAAGGAGASTNPAQIQGGTFNAFSVSPDGSCGGTNSYTCTGSQGGIQPCCSASGFCGSGQTYCGAGCQSLFGTCGSTQASSFSTTPAPSASSSFPVPSSSSLVSLSSLVTFSPSPLVTSSTTSNAILISSSTASLSALAAHPPRQTITVGRNGNTFSPESVVAGPGDKVVFLFYPGVHSVAQSSSSDPCHPLSPISIYSGQIRNQGTGPSTNLFTITINDTNPIYMYCGVGAHCQSGMVFLINPPSGSTLDVYRLAAARAGASTTPAAIEGGVYEDTSLASSSSLSSTSTIALSPSPSASGGVTPDGTCGGPNGYTCAGSQGGIQPCCSASGFCGNGPLYCGVGCQRTFGSCNLFSSSPSPLSSVASSSGLQTSPTTSSKISSSSSPPTLVPSARPVTPDGSCGSSSLGGYTCTGIQGIYLPCCSVYGYCGDGPTYCGDGCQSGYGICDSSSSSIMSVLPSNVASSSSTAVQSNATSSSMGSLPTLSNDISPDGRCGLSVGYSCLNSYFGNCCSEYGFCGDLGEYCGTGCQPQYGNCNSGLPLSSIDGISISTTLTTAISVRSTVPPSSTMQSSTQLGGVTMTAACHPMRRKVLKEV